MPTIPNMPNMPTIPGMPSMSSLRIPGRKENLPAATSDSAPDPGAMSLSNTEDLLGTPNKETDEPNTDRISDQEKQGTTTQEVKENIATPLSVIRSPVKENEVPPLPHAAAFKENNMQQQPEGIQYDSKSAEQQTLPIESSGKISKRTADEMSKDDEGSKADEVLKAWTLPQGGEALRVAESPKLSDHS